MTHKCFWHIIFPPAEMITALGGTSEYHLRCTWREHRCDRSNVNRRAPVWDTVWQVSPQRNKHQAVSCKLWPFLLSLGAQCQSEFILVSVSQPMWLLGRQCYFINHIVCFLPLSSQLHTDWFREYTSTRCEYSLYVTFKQISSNRLRALSVGI